VAVDSLVRMANQIAANVAHHPFDQSVEEVASHMRLFWAPTMRVELRTYADADGAGLDPIALAAVRSLPSPSMT
jgi:formate dehydrogenase subunit delta